MMHPVSIALSLLLCGIQPAPVDEKETPVPESGTETPSEYTVAFWNLENLFDYEDDPDNPGDDEYLPEKEWDQARYERKLDHLAKAVQSMEADLLAVCEVENRRVLEDLTAHPDLAADQWSIVHRDSPDRRGIDLALLYRKPFAEEGESILHTIDIGEGNTSTRGVLEVPMSLSGTPVTFLVNHWPSRWGGAEESAPKRKAAAAVARKIIDGHLSRNAAAEIIVLGDLNDDPWDSSVREVLKAVRELRAVTHPSNTAPRKEGRQEYSPRLWNPSWIFANSTDNGTYYYWNGWCWNCFDQIIVSSGLLDDTGLQILRDSVEVHAPDFMKDSERNAFRPARFRKFRGRWEEGYSDHFAVKCKVTLVPAKKEDTASE
jgi:endonuclease/exonuclease/phosphatase family metal-dependent hydrolase